MTPDISVGPLSIDGQWDVEQRLSESHAVLWAVVILASVFDVVTTISGLGLGLEEGNAIAQAFIETYGAPGIGLLKFSALVLLVLLWATLPDRYTTLVLAVFAWVSLLVVTLNAITLAVV